MGPITLSACSRVPVLLLYYVVTQPINIISIKQQLMGTTRTFETA